MDVELSPDEEGLVLEVVAQDAEGRQEEQQRGHGQQHRELLDQVPFCAVRLASEHDDQQADVGPGQKADLRQHEFALEQRYEDALLDAFLRPEPLVQRNQQQVQREREHQAAQGREQRGRTRPERLPAQHQPAGGPLARDQQQERTQAFLALHAIRLFSIRAAL